MNLDNKVGLVTYYKENYGSVLQCYAIKTFIEKNGYKCYVLFQKFKGGKISINRLKNIIKHVYRAIRYKGYYTQYMSMHSAMLHEKRYITKNAHNLMDSFIELNIQPKGYTWNELCQLGRMENFKAFIAGSDQIWNASITIQPMYFLKFTNKEKRIALAPSFGISKIPEFNLKSVKHGLQGFENISVREEAGEEIVKKYSTVPVTRIADPTIFLSKSQWIDFGKSRVIPTFNYIFVHFLNRPSETAINSINLLVDRLKCQVLCLSYDYPEYDKIASAIHIDGSPIDYVGLINSAVAICTDSFHSTLFSLILNKSFYTFQRQYLHMSPQTSRIDNLLTRYNCSQRFISSEEQIFNIQELRWNEINQLIEKERKISIQYLLNELSNKN